MVHTFLFFGTMLMVFAIALYNLQMLAGYDRNVYVSQQNRSSLGYESAIFNVVEYLFILCPIMKSSFECALYTPAIAICC